MTIGLDFDPDIQASSTTALIPAVSKDLCQIISEISEGAPAWCMLSNLFFEKLDLTAICAQCQQPYQDGMCVFPGCSSPTGAKIKGVASVFVEVVQFQMKTIYITGDNVRTLLGGDERVWNCLLELTTRRGTLFHSGRRGEHNSVFSDVFDSYCDVALNERDYQAYIRRFKPSGYSKSYDFYCIQLLSLKPTDSLRMIRILNGVENA